MARAVLEAVGYALRDSVAVIEEVGGPVGAIRLSGARAGNHWLNRIKADIVGRPLLVPEVLDAELTGCACVAARALGVDASVGAAAARLVKIGARSSRRHSMRPCTRMGSPATGSCRGNCSQQQAAL